MAGIPVQLGATPGKLRHPPPTVGQHTSEVLHEWLGYNEEMIAQLRNNNVV
jgi:CoA:oxalate CoA-transferase